MSSMMKSTIGGFSVALAIAFGVGTNKGCTKTTERLQNEIKAEQDAISQHVKNETNDINRKCASDESAKRADVAKRKDAVSNRLAAETSSFERSFHSAKTEIEREIAGMASEKEFIQTVRSRVGSDVVAEFQSVGSDLQSVRSVLHDAEAVYVAFDRTKWIASDWRSLTSLQKDAFNEYGEIDKSFRKAARLIKVEQALNSDN